MESTGIELVGEISNKEREVGEFTETANCQEENIAILAGLREYDEGVDERDDVNTEHEVTDIKEVKKKKKKK